jgi:hypothetical protein
MHLVVSALLLAATASVGLQAAPARQKPAASPAANPERINACSLLTREEVKKLVPWIPMLDQFKTEEEALGATGSACVYPSVHIQVLPFSQGTIDAARKRGKLEPVAGVGDEAYLYENPAGYAELYAKVGTHLLTIQKSVRPDEKMDAAKPPVIALAKAFVAKLR